MLRMRHFQDPAGHSRMDPVLRRLARRGLESSRERQQIEGLGRRSEVFPAKTTLQAEGDAIRRPRFLVSGWACRLRDLSDGRRQLFEFVLPGDGVGVCLRPSPLAQTTTLAITRVELVDASELLRPEVLAGFPEVDEALHRAEQDDHRRLLDHVVRLGRLDAVERVAHLLLELHDRLDTVGMVRDGRFPMPLTQEVLADGLGLSVVHLNRTLQEMRRQGLATARGGEVVLLDPAALALMADYSARDAPRYY